jgi:hypothetical protein
MNNFRFLLIACCAILASCGNQKFAYRKTYPADQKVDIARQQQSVPAIIENRIALPGQASASLEPGVNPSAISPRKLFTPKIDLLLKPVDHPFVSLDTTSTPVEKKYDGKPILHYSNPWATIGFASSIFGLFLYPVIFCGMGMVLCFVSLTRPGKRGFAIAGIIIGMIGFIGSFWFLAVH